MTKGKERNGVGGGEEREIVLIISCILCDSRFVLVKIDT